MKHTTILLSIAALTFVLGCGKSNTNFKSGVVTAETVLASNYGDNFVVARDALY